MIHTERPHPPLRGPPSPTGEGNARDARFTLRARCASLGERKSTPLIRGVHKKFLGGEREGRPFLTSFSFAKYPSELARAVEISSDTGNKCEEERSVFTYMTDSETRSFRSKRSRFCQTRSVCRFSADNIAVSGLTEMLCRVEEIFSGKEWSGRRHERIHIRDCRRLALILPHEEIYSRESGDTKYPSEDHLSRTPNAPGLIARMMRWGMI